MAGKAVWDYLFDDEAPAEAAPVAAGPVDAGPAARRAAAGMPPEAGTVDPEGPSPPISTPSAFDQNRAALGTAIGTPRPFADPNDRSATPRNIQFATATDPIAQGVVMTPILGPAGRAISAGASKVVGPALAPVASGGITGAAAAKSMGGDADEGAAFGMALPALRIALGGVGAAEARALASRGDGRLYREIGAEAPSTKVQADIQRLGKERVGKISRELGLQTAPDKRAVVQNDLRATGTAIGDAYAALDAAPTGRSIGGIMTAGDKVRGQLVAKYGQVKGEELYGPVHDEMQKLWEAHGASPGAMIPLGELNKTIRGFEAAGMKGARADALSETARAVSSRAFARALNTELDAGLDLAGQNPALAPAVNRLHDLNSRYRTLKVLEPVANRMSLKGDFGPAPSAAFQPGQMRPGNAVRRMVGAAAGAIPRAGDRLAAMRGPGSMAGSPTDVIPLSPVTYGALKANNRETLEAQLAAELFPK